MTTHDAPPVDHALLEEATAYANAAAELTLTHFRDARLVVDRKADGSFVTDADRGAEDLLRSAIRSAHPDDAIVGEERGNVEGSSGRTWVIDPIDGTESFVRGVPLYATLLAVFDEHGPAVGVVVVPALGLGAAAGRGLGCHWEGTPLRVSSTGELARACVSSSSFDQPWWPADALGRVTSCGARTRTWGDGYGYVLVAAGNIDAMVDPDLHLWDIAPMLTVIPEAGGTLTRWSGETSLGEGGWLATNGVLHEPLRRTLLGEQ